MQAACTRSRKITFPSRPTARKRPCPSIWASRRTSCPYYAELPYADQDKYLLCSDGLTDMVPPEDIARILAKFPAEQAAQILLQNALDNGGKDNVSLLAPVIGRPAATGLLDRIRNLF